MKCEVMKKRILAMSLVLLMIITSFQIMTTKTTYASIEQQMTTYMGDCYQVTFCVSR